MGENSGQPVLSVDSGWREQQEGEPTSKPLHNNANTTMSFDSDAPDLAVRDSTKNAPVTNDSAAANRTQSNIKIKPSAVTHNTTLPPAASPVGTTTDIPVLATAADPTTSSTVKQSTAEDAREDIASSPSEPQSPQTANGNFRGSTSTKSSTPYISAPFTVGQPDAGIQRNTRAVGNATTDIGCILFALLCYPLRVLYLAIVAGIVYHIGLKYMLPFALFVMQLALLAMPLTLTIRLILRLAPCSPREEALGQDDARLRGWSGLEAIWVSWAVRRGLVTPPGDPRSTHGSMLQMRPPVERWEWEWLLPEGDSREVKERQETAEGKANGLEAKLPCGPLPRRRNEDETWQKEDQERRINLEASSEENEEEHMYGKSTNSYQPNTNGILFGQQDNVQSRRPEHRQKTDLKVSASTKMARASELVCAMLLLVLIHR